MTELGQSLSSLGDALLPYSFAAYMPFRWLEYVWKRNPNRLVKGIWYAALGMALLTKDVSQDVIVMYICFIEACDLSFQQMEIRREAAADVSRKSPTSVPVDGS